MIKTLIFLVLIGISGISGLKLKDLKCNHKKLNVTELKPSKDCYDKYMPSSSLWTKVKEQFKSTKTVSEENQEKLGCVFFCQKKHSWMNEEGKILSDKMNENIQSAFPTPENSDITSAVKNCLDKFGDTFKLNEKDGKCKDIFPFEECYYKAMHQVCGWKNYKEFIKYQLPF